jgi:O-antigen/teichoic acid export membrane protein
VTSAARSSHARVAAHAGVTFVGLMAANVLNYVFYALVSRTLGVESYGTFSALVAVVLIVSAPAMIGQLVVAKLAAEYASDPQRLSGLVRLIDGVTIVVAAVPALLLACAAVPLAQFLHVGDPLLIVLAACSLAGAIALPLLRGVQQGTSAFVAFALSNAAEGAGKALFASVLAAFAGLRGAVGGMAIGYAAAAVSTFVAARPHGRATPAHVSLREIARASAPVALAVFCVNVLLLYDVVLAKRYLDAHTAGLYGAVALSGRALYAVIAFVPTVLLPQAAERSARGERTRYLFAQAFVVTLAICACAIALFAFAPRFVVTTIAGRSFAGAAQFALPYVLAITALGTANIVATYNIARGRMRFVLPLACVAAGEIVAVVLRHRSAADLLQTIVVGHTLALLACATSLGGRTGRGAIVTARESSPR